MTAEDNLNVMNEMGDKGLERITSLGELNMRTLEKMTSRQMDIMNLMMEQGMRQMKLATESKGYNEFMQGQMELAKEMSERMMEESKANVKIAGDVRDEYRAFFQKGMSEMSDEIRKVNPSA